PADGLPLITDPLHGLAQTIRIGVNVFQRSGFRADVAAAEGVLFITLDGDDLVATGFDFQSANGFAEMAGAVVSLNVVGHGADLLLLCRSRRNQSGSAKVSGAGCAVEPCGSGLAVNPSMGAAPRHPCRRAS